MSNVKWNDRNTVRPRLHRKELLQIYMIVDEAYWETRRRNRYWSFRGRENLKPLAQLRKKLLRSLNSMRQPEHKIDARQKYGVKIS